MFRGGRSGPSAANASTVGAVVMNTVGAGSVAGTTGAGPKSAPNEQQDAQALHFCWGTWPALLAAKGSSTEVASETAPVCNPCTAKKPPS